MGAAHRRTRRPYTRCERRDAWLNDARGPAGGAARPGDLLAVRAIRASTPSSPTRRSTRRPSRDPEGFWAEQAEALDWDEKWDQVLDWSNPPFAKWFVGGKLNVSYNCVDRHVEAGNGDRVAFHWRGEEGEERDITYADLHRDVQQLRQRAEGPRDRHGRRRRDLPADDPRGRRGDARLRAHRRAAQRRLRRLLADSVKERMEFSEAKALVTVDGARRKGKTAPIKQQVDEEMGDLEHLETIIVVQHTDADCSMQEGRDFWWHDRRRGRRRRVPGRAAGRRAPALHPLHVAARRPSRRASCTPPAAT